MSDQSIVEIIFLGRFKDAYFKYKHAQMHLTKLVELINELQKDGWWQPERVDDRTVRIKLLREPTIEWSLIIGDLIHNLRGCLDYATCGMVEVGEPSASLKNIQFPFGRLGLPLNSDERRRLNGLEPEAIKRIENVRTTHGADLRLVNLMSNQDKHRLLLPVAIRKVPLKITVDKANNTAAIEEDIEGNFDLRTKEIKDGDEMPMPNMLKLDIGLVIEGEPNIFPIQDLLRVNNSVWNAFMLMCATKR